MQNKKSTWQRRTAISAGVALYMAAAGNAAAGGLIDWAKNLVGIEPTSAFRQVELPDIKPLSKAGAEPQGIYAGTTQINRLYGAANQKFKAEPGLKGEHDYIVELTDAALPLYNGERPGLQATQRQGARVDLKSKAAKDYRKHLKAKQEQLTSAAASHGLKAKVVRNYYSALNGMAVRMSQADAERMSQLPGVKSVQRSRMMKLHTDRGPAFIGADQVWQGNIFSGISHQGEGVVVGVIDTGINTDHPSFAATGTDGYTVSNPRGSGNYLGDCVADESLCNDKLIGVYSYREITDAYADPAYQPDVPWWDVTPLRPSNGEDYNGHGSHTASTAAGNALISIPFMAASSGATGDGLPTALSFPQLSGVAPHANLISYQVCYPGSGNDLYAGCAESAMLAAIEQAINDGVDVINMSIGGGESYPWTDATERAFLAAREAGINVAVSAGNSGPDYYSADHTSPWLMSVGATNTDRHIEIPDKQIGDYLGGVTPPWGPINGRSLTGTYTGPVVWAGSYSNPNATDAPELCNAPFPAGTFSVDPAGNPLATAPIVVCKRGVAARVQKALNVVDGGAGGFVLYNQASWGEGSDLALDVYAVPGIHIGMWEGSDLVNWLSAGSGHEATITASVPERNIEDGSGDFIADFSSRGPSRTNPHNIVPNIMAPGVQIYAAFADDQPFTAAPAPADFTLLQGTSMAAPHVAGSMALVRQAHPDWSAAEVQSALMLTAAQTPGFETYFGREMPNSPYASGSGRVDVVAAINAGLVMDETAANYLAADPENGGRVEWLNIPSLANLKCQQSCSWVRKFRATRSGSWSVRGEAMPGYDMMQLSVTPAQFTVTEGQVVQLQVTATFSKDAYSRTQDNQFGQFFGDVILTEAGGQPESRLKVAAALAQGGMPRQIDLQAHRDNGSYTVTGLSTQSMPQPTARVYGMVAPTVQEVVLQPDSFWLNPFDDPSDGAHWQLLEVPAGTKRLVLEALSITADDYTWANVEQPKVLIGKDSNGDGLPPTMDTYHDELLCMSFAKWQGNYCSIQDPEPGMYWIMIHNGHPVNYTSELGNHDRIKFAYALVDGHDASNLTVSAPASHDGANPLALTFGWDLTELNVGDVRYGAMDLGPSAAAAGAFGMSGVRLERLVDDAALSVSKTAAKAGDVIDLKLHILENLETADRNLDINVELPAGLTVVPGSVQYGSNLNGMVSVSNGTLRVAGTQPSTAAIERTYKVTSNDTSATCRMPNPGKPDWHGGYVDLFSEASMQPQDGISGDYNNVFRLPMDWLFFKQADIEVYGQPSRGWMDVSPVGLLRFDDTYWPWDYEVSMNYGGNLLRAIAPFWRGSLSMESEHHWEDPKGLTLATVWKEDYPELGDLLYLEYDNIKDMYGDAELDFEVVLRNGTDFEPNKPEIYFAYNNISGDVAQGSIGTRGYAGAMDWDEGPLEGWLINQLGYNNLDQVISNNKVYCLDYDGPERSRMDISLQVRVHENAASQQLTIKLLHAVGAVPTSERLISLPVAGNLQLQPIADQTVDEDETLEGIEVDYIDADNLPNAITVTGQNVTAVIHDDNSFDLKPTADFNGETTVTVTVHDATYPNDRSSTQFKLTVNPVDDPTVSPPRRSSGGGSVPAVLILGMAALLTCRRRRH